MNTVHAERVGDGIEIGNNTFMNKELLRAIPGSRFSSPPPTWTFPLTWTACLQLRYTFGAGLSLGDELKAWASRELETRIKPAMALKEALDAPEPALPPPAGLTLRDFQKADVAWMLSAGSGILMSPTGAGKTVSTLTWMRNLTLETAVVVCPAAMKQVWADEARKWYPELEPIVVSGSPKERREKIIEAGKYGGICIMTWQAMRLHSRLAPYGQVKLSDAEKRPKDLNEWNWEAVIADEGHYLADPKSKQTRATWHVGIDADYRWALTATPETKGLDTLWPVLHFMAPDEFPSKTKFVDRYAEASTDFWGNVTFGACKPEREKEFLEVIGPRTRRLPKKVVLPHLPKIIPIRKMIPMEAKQEAAYEQMAEMSLAEVSHGDVISATSTGARYTRLGQFASSYAYLDEERLRRNRKTGEMEPFRPVELEMPSNKISALLEDLEHSWLPGEESVAVFATSKRLLDLTSAQLTKKKIKHSMIVGGQQEMERHEQIAAFQRAEVPVILVVIKAGGAGITLTQARIAAFMQRSWSHVEDTQSIGRINRIGSEIHESQVRVDYVTPGTVEVGQLDVTLPGKEHMLQQVLRDEELIKKMIRGERITGDDLNAQS
jgi:SNF2 family DNA or RNA helicase